MRNALTASVVFLLLGLAPLSRSQDTPADPEADLQPEVQFTPDQLDNLLAPVALYPDPLLAQLLIAAGFPDEIDAAAKFVAVDVNLADIDGQPWDVSVKAVAHYPTVLKMMADQLDWTTALGQAYVGQPEDVMACIQRLRVQAQAEGNLQSDADIEVNMDDDGSIDIWPAQAVYIYVPEYDPSTVYVRHGGIFFGTGYFIGAWLNRDINWGNHKIYYHGWTNGKAWNIRSRPYISMAGTYVNNKQQDVAVNRTVVNRRVNYKNLSRFDSVHREVSYQNPVRSSPGTKPQPRTPVTTAPTRTETVGDTRVEEHRGRSQDQPRVPSSPPFQSSGETPREPARDRSGEVHREESRPAPQRNVERPAQDTRREVERTVHPTPESRPAPRSEAPRQEAPRPAPAPRQEAPRQEAPRQEVSRPAPPPAPRSEPARSEPARSEPARSEGSKDDGKHK